MFLHRKITPLTNGYWSDIGDVAQRIADAEGIILGIGSGLSAAGGLDYTSRALAHQWFPEYVAAGCKNIVEIQSLFWRQGRCKLESYWGYWARHIWHIRYETPVTQPYLDLMELLRGKGYFVSTTNADGQVQKAGFPREKVFAPQGNYQYFQCSKPCSRSLYDNREMVERMIANMANATDIRTEDIPKCPKCGANLVPNLRCDDKFVGEPHMWNAKAYEKFITDYADRKILLLELGVGFNTPVIIRFPFERMAKHFPDTHLVRVNLVRPEIPHEIADHGTAIQADIKKVLQDLLGYRLQKPDQFYPQRT